MKRFFKLALVGVTATSMILTGCAKGQASSSKGGEPIEINFYSVAGGDDYYNDILVPMFEKATSGKYKVNYNRGGWQEVLNKIQAQGDKVNIDVIVSGLDGVPAGAKAGVLDQLYPKYKSEIRYDELNDIGKAYVEKFNGFGAPVMNAFGGPMIAYNSKNVQNPPKNYEELKQWIKEHPGKFTYATVPTSGPGRGFYFGLIQSLGEDFNKPENLSKSWNYLEEISQYIDYYPSKTGDTLKLLLDGTVDIIPHLPGWFANLTSQGTLPENIKLGSLEGAKQIMDAHFYVMPTKLSEERKKAALEFINFAMSKEANSQTYVRFEMSTNKNASIDLLDDKSKEIYNKGIGTVPKQYMQDNKMIAPANEWILFPDPEALSKNYELWEQKIQAKKK